MKIEEISKLAPYQEEHYKRCWAEGYIAALQSIPTREYEALKLKEDMEKSNPVFPSDQEVQKASEQYADGMWLSGSSWADAARKTFLAGANWMKYHID